MAALLFDFYLYLRTYEQIIQDQTNFWGAMKGKTKPWLAKSISRGVARGGAGVRAPPPGIWQISYLYSNHGGQIMPVTLLPAPPRIQNAIYTSDISTMGSIDFESSILELR